MTSEESGPKGPGWEGFEALADQGWASQSTWSSRQELRGRTKPSLVPPRSLAPTHSKMSPFRKSACWVLPLLGSPDESG